VVDERVLARFRDGGCGGRLVHTRSISYPLPLCRHRLEKHRELVLLSRPT
jgi:hypothetical protein